MRIVHTHPKQHKESLAFHLTHNFRLKYSQPKFGRLSTQKFKPRDILVVFHWMKPQVLWACKVYFSLLLFTYNISDQKCK